MTSPLGEAAAEAALPKLRERQLSPEAYAAWRAGRVARLRPIGPIERVALPRRPMSSAAGRSAAPT